MNIGLTGGLGCGKSTALSFFRDAGAVTVDTDALGHEVLRSDKELIAKIREAFGDGVFDSEGRIDRGKLAGRVFDNSEALAILESLVHPRIREAWMRKLGENHPLLVVEIPLLFENDLQKHFPLTLCLSCDPEVQKSRLKARGMSDSNIQKRKLRQLSLDEKMRRADIILYNNGTLEHLRAQVEHVVQQVCPPSTP